MSFFIQRIFDKVWEKVGMEDRARMKTLILPRGIQEVERQYVNDRDPFHSLSYCWKVGAGDNLPVIIDIHGGGWMYGTKANNRPFSLYMASLGFGVMTMSYRLSPDVKLKDMVRDIFAAMTQLWMDRFRLPFDFTRVSLVGDSAGAMLASLLVGAEHSPSLQKAFGIGKLPFSIKALVMNHPVCYPAEMVLAPDKKLTNALGVHQILGDLYGFPFPKATKLYQLTGSLDSVLAQTNSKFVPTLVITSKGDNQFHQMGIKTYETLKAKGISARLYDNSAKPDGHIFNVALINAPASIKTNKALADFLLQHVGEGI